MARPTKLTQEVHDLIVEAVRAGNYYEVAARAAGVEASTFYKWMKRGREGKGKRYVEFFHAVEQARAEAERESVEIVRNAAKKDWAAASWWLERIAPARWGRRDKFEVTGAEGGPVQVVINAPKVPGVTGDEG